MKNNQKNTVKIRQRIKTIMKEKRISVNKLCDTMKVNRNYLRETNQYTYERISVIAKALNVTIYDIIDIEGWTKLYNEKGELIKIERND